jgi:serine/threonine protein kinase
VTDPSLDSTTPLLGIKTLPIDRKVLDPMRLGDYDVIGLLARGGMGGVYLGAHTKTGHRVALKVLDPHWARNADIVARMFAEHAFANRARHAGLLEIHAAAVDDDGVPYLVMELLDGENLGDLVERGRLVPGAIAAIGAQIARAVASLHLAGVVHCDIKPDNVFVLYEHGLSGWPRVKVLDYGVSRQAGEVTQDSIAGTPSCMAPEQWRGAPSAKSDVYSLGCVMYWLATGAPPFAGTLPQLMLAHANKLPERPSTIRKSLPPELERLILRMLAKDPGMRPAMRDIARELVNLANHYPQEAELLEATG